MDVKCPECGTYVPEASVTPRGGSLRFFELLEEMGNVHAAKNSDYSPGADPFGNFREAEGIGVPAWVGAWVRLQDKYKRVQGLIAQFVREGRMTPAVVNEKLDDTVIDLANYAVIVRCLYEEWLRTEQAKPTTPDPLDVCVTCRNIISPHETRYYTMHRTVVCRNCVILIASFVEADNA